jgi:parallel beta-helix repeat protein
VKKFLASISSSIFAKSCRATLSSSKAGSDGHARHEALEPRLLFSADVAPLALAMPSNDSQVVQAQPVQSSQMQLASTELVVIDSRVAEPDLLLADIAQQQSAGRSIHVLTLTSAEDAIAGIQNALDDLTAQGFEVSAIHIVSHGRDGEFDLGNAVVDDGFLKAHALGVASWSSSLSADADILVYGCNFAQSSKGQLLAINLSALTGADVAANLQASGSAALGGDWTLDFVTGAIESSHAFTSAVETNWNHLLATGSLVTYASPSTSSNVMSTGPITDVGPNRTGGRTVAVDGAGNYVAVWTDGTQKQIMITRFLADGTRSLAPTPVTAGNNQIDPAIAMAQDGSFVVLWSEKISGRLAIVGQRGDSNGVPVGNAFLIASNPSEDCIQASIAINEDKDFVVAWQRNNGSQLQDVFTRSFHWGLPSAAPVPIIAELAIGALPAGSFAGVQERPVIAINGNRVYLAWEGPDTGTSGIFLRSYDLDGSNATTPIQVNTSQSYRDSAPDIAVAPDGRIIVAWQEDVPTLNADVTHFRIFEETGTISKQIVAVSSELTTDPSLGHDQTLPKLAVSDTGEFIITYQRSGQTIVRTDNTTQVDAGWGVFFKVFDRNGVQTVSETSVSDTGNTYFTDFNQHAVNVDWHGGKAVFAWTGNTPNPLAGGNDTIFTRQFAIYNPQINAILPPATVLNVGGLNRPMEFALNTQPTADVILNITTSNVFGGVDKTQLIFTKDNWQVKQTVMVSAVDGPIRDAIELFDVRVEVDATSAVEYRTVLPTPFGFISDKNVLHTIDVNTESDVADAPLGSTLSDLVSYRGADGLISLREALLAANNTPNIALGTPDVIQFNIVNAVKPQYTINILSALPVVSDAVVIDGLSQNGALPSQPKIMIDGNHGHYNGFLLASAGNGIGLSQGSTIRGLGIQNFDLNGIVANSSDNKFEQNVIVNNNQAGIIVFSNSGTVTNNSILSNIVSFNGYAGIHLQGTDNGLVQWNVVSHNVYDGILVNDTNGVGAVGNEINANRVGGNGTNGIHLSDATTTNTNVHNNYIGFDENYQPLGNITNGVLIENGASNNDIGGLVGGPNPLPGNVIANNGLTGVRVVDGTNNAPNSINNRILGNSIYNTGALGIDLTAYDSTISGYPLPVHNINDTGDVFVGPNGYINSPTITAVSATPTGAVISGLISGATNAYYRVEFFSSPSANANASGFGDGREYLGHIQTSTSSGSGILSFSYAIAGVLPLGTVVAATMTRATDSTYSVLEGTSEFSNARVVQAAPVFTSGNFSTTVQENSLPFVIDAKQELIDPSATGITFSLDSAGTDNTHFTLNPTTGELTVPKANYEDLLNDIGGPRDHARSVRVIATDGTNSTVKNFLIYYLDVNEPISLTVNTTPSITEDTPLQFSGVNSIVISDPDEGTTPNPIAPVAASAVTFAISAELLNATPSGNFSFNNLPTGLQSRLAINPFISSVQITGTLADVNQALTYLVYQPATNSTATVQLSFSVSDNGSGISGSLPKLALTTREVVITAVNDPTYLTFPNPSNVITATISAGDSYQLGIGTLKITDADIGAGQMQLSVVVNQGTLSIVPFVGINIVTGSSGGPILVIEGDIASLEQALNNILFSAAFGAKGTTSIDVTVVDISDLTVSILPSTSNSITIYVSSPPVISNVSPTITINEGKATPTKLFSTDTVSDYDGEPLQQMRFHYNASLGPDEQVTVPTVFATPSLVGVNDTINGIFTIIGSASIAEYQSYVQQLAYQNLAVNPTSAPRTFTVEVFDGVHWSNIATTNIFITSVNSIPSVTIAPSMPVAYGQEINLASASVAIPFQVYDNDANTSLLEFRISVTSGLLRFDNTQNLAALGNSTGAKSYFITGTLSQLNIALGNIYYRADPGFEGNDNLTLSIDDFGGTGLPAGQSLGLASSTITALAGIPPTVSLATNALVYVENSIPLSIFDTALIGGSNQGNITLATVTIVGGYENGSDQLAGAGIWSAATGQLKIQGPMSVAAFQTLLQKITFQNNSDNPGTGKRELLVQVFDGLQNSVPQSIFIEVVATNDAPILTDSATGITSEDTALSLANFKIADVFDVDSSGLSLSIQATHGSFVWGVSGAIPLGVEILANGFVKLTGSAFDINTWSMQLSFIPDANFNGVSDVTWTVSDTEPAPITVSKQSQIQINSVNDIPVWQGISGLGVLQGGSAPVLIANSKAIDVEDTSEKLTYQLTALPTHGQLFANGVVLTLGDQFTQADIDSGRVEYRHGGGAESNDSLRLKVSDSQGAQTAEKTLAISISLRAAVIIAPPTGSVNNTVSVNTSSGTGGAVGSGTAIKDVAATTSAEGGLTAGGIGGATTTSAGSGTSQKAASSPSRSGQATNTASSLEASSSPSTVPTNASGERLNQDIALRGEKLIGSVSSSKDNAISRQDSFGSYHLFKIRSDIENQQYAGIIRSALSDNGFFEDVQKGREALKNSVKLDRNVVATGTVASATLSIGYVIWLVRGGALMSSLLASIPAWRIMDPLPILGRMGDDEGDSDDESLDSMIEKSRAKKLLQPLLHQ